METEIKKPVYDLKAVSMLDSLVLTKNGKPMLIIPKEHTNDIIEILSGYNTYNKFVTEKTEP